MSAFGTGELIMTLAVALCVTLAAFLAMAETSLTRINRVRAMTLAEEGRRGSRSLLRLLEHPERFLNPVLLLLLVCHLVAATLVGVLAQRLVGTLGIVLATVFEIIVIFVVAEAMPKTYAIQHPDRASLLVAPVVSAIVGFSLIRLISRGLISMANLLLPGTGLKEGPFISEAELLALADVAVEEEVIEKEERALIHSIIEFGDTIVREVMVPRTDMVSVDARTSVADATDVAIGAGFSRLPIYGQGIDDIVGIVYAKDLIRAEREGRREQPVREVARAARFVPETKRVSILMREMQAEKSHMAIVVDEYGGTAGLVTLEDLLEELVGEIVDEYDTEEPQVERLPNGDVRVNGRMPIDELNELLHAQFSEDDWDTVGGLVFSLLGHVPTEGESVVHDGHQLRVERVQGRRIGRVRISPVEQPEPRSESES